MYNPDPYGNLPVRPSDSTTDAFSRLRVAAPFQVFAAKLDFNPCNHLFNDITASGGTINHVATASKMLLSVNTTNGSRALRRAKQRVPYQPGKSTLAVLTGVIGAGQPNTIKRIGLFDDENGAFFELNGTTKRVVVRSKVSGSVVEDVIPQSQWNLDTLDGTGRSKIILDWEKIQIFIVDYQWLGAGRVRFGFDIGGDIIYCHEIAHANITNVVWSRTGNLPVSYEIVNTGVTSAPSSLDMICQSVLVEGGFEDVGADFSYTMTTPKATNNTSLLPLIMIRAKSGRESAPVIPSSMELFAATADNHYWQVILNPTLNTGVGTVPTYNSANADSNFELDVSCTHPVTGGRVLASGFLTTQARVAQSNFSLNTPVWLGQKADGSSDVLAVCARSLTNGANMHAALNWKEFE